VVMNMLAEFVTGKLMIIFAYNVKKKGRRFI